MKYLRIFVNQVLIEFSYRFDFMINVISNIVQLLMSIFVWRTIFNNGNNLVNYSIDQLTSYLVITNLLAVLFSFDPIFRLGKLIHSGKLNQLLIRPVNLLYENFSFYMGKRVLPLLIILPLFVFVMISFGAFNFNYLITLSLYLIACLVMFFLMVMCISTLSFWIIEIWPLRPVLSGIYMLFGGLFFPLDILPKDIFNVVKYNPFSLIGHYSTSIALGNVTNDELLILFVCLGLYCLIFERLYNTLIKSGLKHYEGGGN